MVRLGDYVARIGPHWRSAADLRWSARIAATAGAQVPEAIAPIPAVDGGYVAVAAGRPITLWPFITGRHADHRDRQQRRQAAHLLARVHRTLSCAEFGAPPHRDTPTVPVPDLADDELDAWLENFHADYRERQPVHGDFYAGNVLVRSGTIVALVDWDEVSLAPPEWELAHAAWEWCDGLATLDLTDAHRFIDDYLAAGGTATRIDETSLRQLIRSRIRGEVAYDRATSAPERLTPDDREYQEQQLRAFQALRPGHRHP